MGWTFGGLRPGAYRLEPLSALGVAAREAKPQGPEAKP